MAVLSISRQFGAGGKTLGQRLAQRLGYQFVYKDVLQMVAEEAGVSTDWVEAVERGAGDRLMRLISTLVPSDFIERHLGEDKSDFDVRKYVTFLRRVIRRIADHGDAVILGRGSQFILADHPDTLRVLLVAELEDRVRFLMEHYHLDHTKARTLVDKEDRRRARFLAELHPGDPNDPSLYHMTLNMSEIGLEVGEALILELVGARLDRQAKPIW